MAGFDVLANRLSDCERLLVDGPRQRRLATVLFTDIVSSTEATAELGDARWRELLSRHHAIVRRLVKRFGGREMDTTGDGFFVIFASPGNAVRCACAASEAVPELGVEIRAGLHVGEIEEMGAKVAGLAVVTAARLLALAGAGEVLVSSTVSELVAGSGLEFEDRGVHELKGVPGPRHVLAVAAVDGAPRPGPLEASEAERRRQAIERPPLVARRRGRLLVIAAAVLVMALVAGWATLRSGRAAVVIRPESLLQIDASSGDVVSDAHVPFSDAFSITPAPDHKLWLLSQPDQELAVVDTAPVRLHPPFGGFNVTHGNGGFGLAYFDHAVWASGDTAVVQLDSHHHVTRTVPIPGGPTLISTGLGRLWVTHFNPSSDTTRLYSIKPGADRAQPAGLAARSLNGMVVGAGAVWTINAGGSLWKTIPGQPARTLPLPGLPMGLGFGFNYLWVVGDGTTSYLGGGPATETVSRIDPGTGHVRTFRVGTDTAGIPAGIVQAGNFMWAADPIDRQILRIDPVRLRVTKRIQLPYQPAALTSVDGSVWISVIRASPFF